MKPMKKLRLLQNSEDTNKFSDGEIKITTGKVAFYHGKHHMTDPQNARADFIRLGKRYILKNTGGMPTVEDWYEKELLPKFQAFMPGRSLEEDDRQQDQL